MITLVEEMRPQPSQTGGTFTELSNIQEGQLALPSTMVMTPRQSKPPLNASCWDIPESIRSSAS